MRCLAILLLSLGLWGCADMGADLRSAESLYKDARYEAALQWLHDLEPVTAKMALRERADFYYLRGMTAYRLGQRDDALYFLSLAAAVSDERPGVLRPAFQTVMGRTLDELTPRDGSAQARNPLRPDSL